VNVRFCRSCRTLILSDFRYCPYCGAQAPRGPGIEEALGPSFSRIEAEAAASRLRDDCFAYAEESLKRLEAEVESLCERERGGGTCTER